MTRTIKNLSLSFLFILFLCQFPLIGKENNGEAALISLSNAFKRVAKTVTPSVVTVETTYSISNNHPFHQNPFFRQFAPQEMPQQKGSGSGVIYDAQGHIITNSHVIANAKKIEVILNDDRRFEAKLIGQDPKTDLALLKIDATKFTPAKYGDSDILEVGEWAIAIGNPLGFSHSVTAGIISAKGRHGLRHFSEMAYENFIQTDAAINQGNSGGPLCNLKGEVIGINSMIASSSGGSQGLGFTIPINMVKRIIDQLINSGEIQRGFLGVVIKNVSKPLAKALNYDSTEGALIDDVTPNSPAYRSGLQQGDIIVAMNGEKIKNYYDLRIQVSQTAPNTKVQFTIFRDGKNINKFVLLGQLEDQQNLKLGLSVRSATPEELKRCYSSNGVYIEEVVPGSPADKARLTSGMIIYSVDKEKVHSPEEFNRYMSASLKGDDHEVLLYIKSANTGFVTVLVK